MSNYTLFKLKFTSPLHLAKGKTDYDSAEDMLHSDTLKSALAVCALQLDLISDVKNFLESFKISSAFPFYKDELFFPKPNFLEPEKEFFTFEDEEEKTKNRKEVKKIKWISESYFKELLQGKPKKFADIHKNIQGSFLSFDLTKDDKVYTSETQERVQIPRIIDEEEETTPYYVDRMYFDKDAGLFFLLDTKDEKTIKIIKNSLKLLGDNGLGTDKNVGNGQFETSTSTNFEFSETTSANAFLNLSLYCPQEKELAYFKEQNKPTENKTNFLSYTLLKRGGWIASPQNTDHISLRKKMVFMFGECSIFPKKDNLLGKIVNLKPEYDDLKHDIWRDGQSIFLPIKI